MSPRDAAGVRGFILAGGRSRRFGRDKATAPWEGVPMALRVARAFAAAGVPVVAVARDRRLEALGIATLVEPDPGFRHPLVGVRAALGTLAPGERALVAPCDLPLLGSATLWALLAAGPPAVAEAAERLHPLLAHLDPSALPAVEAVLARRGPVREVAAGWRRVPVPAGEVLNRNREG